MKTVKKIHSFMLLELLIGLALLTLCLMPFVSLPSKSLERELLSLQQLVLNHLSEEACALIKEQIYTQKIAFPFKENKLLVLDDKISLPIQEFAKKPFSRKGVLMSSHKKGKDGIDYFLVKLRVTFVDLTKRKRSKPIYFWHKFFVAQKNSTACQGVATDPAEGGAPN